MCKALEQRAHIFGSRMSSCWVEIMNKVVPRHVVTQNTCVPNVHEYAVLIHFVFMAKNTLGPRKIL